MQILSEGGCMGLEDDPFTWTTRDGRVLDFRGGRQVAVVAGPQAERLRRDSRDRRPRLNTRSHVLPGTIAAATNARQPPR